MLTSSDIARFLLPLRIKLQTIIGRAVLLAVDNSGKSQRLRLKFNGDELVEYIERMQEYGFETVPPIEDSSEAVVLSIGGIRELSLVVGCQARALRPAGLQPGEVQLYSKFGQRVYLKADGSIEVYAKDGNQPINITGGVVTIKGSAVNLKDSGGQPVMLETVITKLNNHTHPYTDDGNPMTTGTMTTGGTTLVAGTDSAANVKAKTG